jgi:hypothetical protein
MGDASENAEHPILNVEGSLVALGSLRRGGFATAF